MNSYKFFFIWNKIMSQQENINKLLEMLKARLNSKGKAKSTDSFGNVVYVDCDIFSDDILECFLDLSLSEFNMIPIFSSFNFENDSFVKTFSAILVKGATLYALASKALIERGREFCFTDKGVDFNQPSISELMQSQFAAELTDHFEKLKLIKLSIGDFKSAQELKNIAICWDQ